ncbi:MAG: response regulator transcription factor [Verrucomicrobiota bacterium]
MSQKKIRVMVVDDNAILRQGLVGAMQFEPDLECIGEAGSAEEAAECYEDWKPDIVTMDYRMTGETGVVGTRRILEADPEARIILFSVFESEEEVWKAVQAGVQGYLTKNASAVDEVMEAIREVAQGGTYFPAAISQKLESRQQQEELTARELEILEFLSAGKSNKEIADHFDLSPSTVKHHITHIREKLGAVDRTQAVVIALKRGILHMD